VTSRVQVAEESRLHTTSILNIRRDVAHLYSHTFLLKIFR